MANEAALSGGAVAALSLSTKWVVKRDLMIAPAIAIVFSVAASAQEIVTPKKHPPSRGHEIAWRFEAPPGPVRSMDARADYEVENIDCVPIDYERASAACVSRRTIACASSYGGRRMAN